MDKWFIKVDDLSYIFEGKRILENVNLEINREKLYCIIGPNGGGKTVLLKLLAGIYLPTKGDVLVSKDGEIHPVDIAISKRKISAGHVFESGGLMSNMNVFDNIALPKRFYKKLSEKEIRDKVNEIIDYMGLRGLVKSRPAQLSMSKQRIVNLAMAISNEPDVILYDNPALGLDSLSTIAIKDLIKVIHAKYNVVSVVATNDLKFAWDIADEIIYFDKTVLAADVPEKILKADKNPIKEFLSGSDLAQRK